MPDVPEYYLPLLYGGIGLVGLISCFFGYRLFKILIIALLAVAGAAALAWVGFEYGEQPVVWSIGGLVIGAVLGGVLALFFYSLAVATIGALFVATTLMPWVQPYALWMQWTILGVACLIAAMVATMVTNLMIQLASAMLGALLLVHSVLFFTSGKTIHQAAEGEDGWVLVLDMDLKVAAIAVGLGLLGFLVQRRSAR
jgi:MFS family permease